MSSVIFIHLGDSPVPRYYYESIDQVSCLSDCDIILVAKSRLRIERLEFGARNVRQLIPAELPKSHLRDIFERSIQANTSFRSGFWQYALERFLILEDAMTALGEESAIHLEGDVLLFQPATQLIEKLRGVYANLATTLDHPDRAVPGFFFVNSRSALERLNRFIVDCLNQGIVGPMFNDMSILAQYRKVFGNLELSALPVLPPSYKGRTENLLGESCQDPSFLWKDSERLGMIFDAAALGQYLGGTDPRNNPLDDRGFINEKSLYDVSSIDISLESGVYILCRNCEKYFPVANLHVHSKQLRQFRTAPNTQMAQSEHSSVDYATPIAHLSLLTEHEIITPEGIQRVADVSITDIPTYRFQRRDLNNPTAIVIVAFDESGKLVLGKDENDILIHSKIIFLNTHLIELFYQNVLTLLTEPVVLITYGREHSINESHRRIADDKRIKAWFSQNLDLIHHKVKPLPNGIANSQFKHGNVESPVK
ncbi:hypothetical protein MCEMSEM47_01887 [Burkholderiales bacterium]